MTTSISQKVSTADRLAAQQGRSEKRLHRRPRIWDRLIHIFLFVCGAFSILTTIGFTIVLGSEALNFFATTEWVRMNKSLSAAIDEGTPYARLTLGGTRPQVGDLLRFGIAEDAEQVRVMRVIDSAEIVDQEPLLEGLDFSLEGLGVDFDLIVVERGSQGSEVSAHPANATVYRGAEVTLLAFFTGTRWAPQIGNFGVLPLVTATFMTSLIAMLVAVPLGLGAAIYLSEYATPRARAILKPIIEVLAGVPTVVYGYFALTFVTPILRSIFGSDVVQVYNMLSAGLVVGILIIPTIASVSEDALTAVPRSLREASYGLGATRLETVSRVLLPAALSGISAAIILGISRAVGETMIVLIAAGAGPNFTFNPFENAETMAGHIARISTGDISRGTIDYNSVFAIGLTLFLATFLLNVASNIITRRFREVYT